MRVEGSVLPPYAVQPRNLRNDIAGTVEVPGSDLVLLAVEIFLSRAVGSALADLEAVVHAPQARQGGCECRPDEKRRTRRVLEEIRIDVGRVDEEVRAEEVFWLGGRELRQVLGD